MKQGGHLGRGHRAHSSLPPARPSPGLTGVDLQAALGAGDEQTGPVVTDVGVGGEGLRVLTTGSKAHLRDQWPCLLATFGRRSSRGTLPEGGLGSLLLGL